MAFTAQLTGNLGRDPEVRYFEDGKVVANFSVAVRQRKDLPARWVKVAIWGKSAQYAADYLRKGDKVALFGRVEPPEQFQGQQGLVIVEKFTAENVEKFSDAQPQGQPQGQPVQQQSYAQASQRVAPPAQPVAAPPPVQQAAQSLAQATGGVVTDYQDDIPF